MLEYPEFTIKEALVVTSYPGASAVEVKQEVSDKLELAVQRMGQLDQIFAQIADRLGRLGRIPDIPAELKAAAQGDRIFQAILDNPQASSSPARSSPSAPQTRGAIFFHIHHIFRNFKTYHQFSPFKLRKTVFFSQRELTGNDLLPGRISINPLTLLPC